MCLGTVQYLGYRRAGGRESPFAWEFALVQTWEQALDPGQSARRIIEGFTQRKPADRWAFPVSTAMYWGYGSGAAAL